ncbi:cytochrome b/b6 domain-containing protein [Microbacterium capsulatum]|uniref:Cytochrome b/b6 domain-containing protein n=1 Tax=Microbacterium capsulatum TaxID=3041921 RepID=A0ABU0XHA0_9MICO|nr:cytochrome b/b6 domain-containing protein [Microbacterium sp. ASV81]MDQ4214486.1 cytochrome b/b6 domain-containing protein [Microbacterium sp. ASV81]
MSATTIERGIRQGLPRVAGGAPWPPVGPAWPGAGTATVTAAVSAPTVAAVAAVEAVCSPSPAVPAATPVSSAVGAGETPLRRGLPREAGGAPWPLAGSAPMTAKTPGTTPATAPATADPVLASAEADPIAVPALADPRPAPLTAREHRAVAGATAAAPATADRSETTPAPAPVVRGTTRGQRAKRIVLGGLGAVLGLGVLVLAARGVTTLPGVPAFLERFPGAYQPAPQPDPGFAPWVGWTHFLNLFFMALIVRTGLLVRHQQKPPAYFAPRSGGNKISIHLWLHTAVDLLWMLNGVVFVVLLAVSGHWARLVPTSWDVVPNAMSAALQYATLDWPTENGWVNYNSLQQLMYFAVVFVAAPLAAITGVRMSRWWPQNAGRLNRLYPAPLARRIHYPVMLFFVVFVIVHVFLVLTTGALKNLGHMFAGSDQAGLGGLWLFLGALVLTGAAVAAVRPLLLAPIAGLFGRVSER